MTLFYAALLFWNKPSVIFETCVRIKTIHITAAFNFIDLYTLFFLYDLAVKKAIV